MQGFVDDREIVGGELLVIQHGRTVLHQAYGWNDLEGGVPIRTDSVFCVRSMTKPLIGTAVLMLVDDRVIALDDKVSKYLPAFDVDGVGEGAGEEAKRGGASGDKSELAVGSEHEAVVESTSDNRAHGASTDTSDNDNQSKGTKRDGVSGDEHDSNSQSANATAKFSPRDITIEQLLRHTSGLPMSLIARADLDELFAQGGIAAVAALGAAHGPETEPGTAFEYSDQGTDTLTALIGAVTGAPPEDFIRARILEPLGMTSSTCLMDAENPLRARALAKYARGGDSWRSFWTPSDPALFPFFLGSQGLYSSAEDYARFLTFWLDKGRVPEGGLGAAGATPTSKPKVERLLGIRYQRKALTPTELPFPGVTGFPNMTTHYGMLMQLWMSVPETEGAEPELVALGHSGSDGTFAWAFPEKDAVVLYFTQSRGTTTGLQVEEALGELLLGVPYNTNLAAPPFDDYLGYYYEGGDDRYRAIVRDGDDLALEILGQAIVPLTFVGDDSWKLRPNPGVVIEFDRDADGRVSGYHIGDHVEYRLEPGDDLPSVQEVCESVTAFHHIERLAQVGPLRMSGTVAMESAGVEGTVTIVIDSIANDATGQPREGGSPGPSDQDPSPDQSDRDKSPDPIGAPGPLRRKPPTARMRADASMGGESEHLVVDGARVEIASNAEPAHIAEAARAASLRADIPQARYGDWREWFEGVQVIQRIHAPEGPNGDLLLVRAGQLDKPCTTFYVEESTGRLIRQDSVLVLPFGRVGQELSFGEYQDVSGMQLPGKSETKLAMPMTGPIMTTYTTFEVGVELAEDTFHLLPQ